MASSISVATPTSTIVSGLVHKPARWFSASPVLGLPSMPMKGGVKCSMDKKSETTSNNIGMSMSASLMAAAVAAATSSPALALVDERLSTEGTGLPFGLSNNLLGWILVGVFALVWSVFFVYTASLDEDEESGLSL